MSILKVSNIRKSFGKAEVLKDISFTLEKGEVLSIIGSSGSGKTTLLRCLNFLETINNCVGVDGNMIFKMACKVHYGIKKCSTGKLIVDTDII